MSSKTAAAPAADNLANGQRQPNSLPLTAGLKPVTLFSLLIAALTAVAAAGGLLYAGSFYPTAELQHSYLANDVITLVIGLPILLIAMGLARRGRLIGLLFWPGALLYGLYNYTAYLFGMPFQGLFVLYLAIVVLSLYTTIALVAGVDGEAVKGRLAGRVPERLGAGVLMLLGAAYMLLALFTLTARSSLPQSELAVFVADLFLSAALLIGGLLLWRRAPLGYVGGTGLLFCAGMLFAGVIAIVILRAVLDKAPFPLADVIILLIMGLICFVPFALFVRGVLRS